MKALIPPSVQRPFNSSPEVCAKRGFTLTEIMIAMAIIGLVMVGLAAFSISGARSIFWATQKSNISREVRHFTTTISKEALNSNVAYLYESFAPSDRNSRDSRLDSGESGNCLVLVSKSPYPDLDSPAHYTNLIVYFFETDDDNGPLRRTEVTFPTPIEIDTSTGADHFETFLATQFPSADGDFPVALEQVRGLAGDEIFQNRMGNMVVVTCEILYGHKIKEVTNTYNLTLTTGG